MRSIKIQVFNQAIVETRDSLAYVNLASVGIKSNILGELGNGREHRPEEVERGVITNEQASDLQ